MTDSEINEAVGIKLGFSKTSYGWNGPKAIFSVLPDYCHDIKAAWEIVDKFEQFDLHKNWDSGKWKCGIGTWDDGGKRQELISFSAPMAICLAFLKLP